MQRPAPSIMNQFNLGLKTEFTGLNFPENAAFAADNCIFNRIGNVTRRPGFDFETNFVQQNLQRSNKAINTYRWKNVGGDGLTQMVVTQLGGTLYFYKSSTATADLPLSTTLLTSTVNIPDFQAIGAVFDETVECQFTDGNGYLFVFHPNCDPFYCKYDGTSSITAKLITIKIRDFTGVPEDNVEDNFRPPTLDHLHQYNLQNQGWTNGNEWSGTGAGTFVGAQGNQTFPIQTGIVGIVVGQHVRISLTYVPANDAPKTVVNAFSGNVVSYTTGTGELVVNVGSVDPSLIGHVITGSITVTPNNTGFIATFFGDLAVYPSNADIWWFFKDSTGSYDPGATSSNVSTGSGHAPSGFYLLDAFNQQRSLASSVPGLTDISTTVRPKTGCWFAGRVWYAGADASQIAVGTAPNYTWTENIYFSQIIEKENQFGKCYQTNDPTSEERFDLLPTDGGVIKIQGCGSIFKLFPVQNGLLIFAANGIWFLTGSQGIGFTANDFTVVRISSIQSISGTSFVDVQGWPMWWNEEGIYSIATSQEATPYGPSRGAVGGNVGLMAQPLTFTTIQSLFDSIPLSSKKHVKGVFDPVDWQVHWLYKSTEEEGIVDRYYYDGVLILNTTTQAFYPYSIQTNGNQPIIHGLEYVQSPGGSNSPSPTIKYLCSIPDGADSFLLTFAEEKDTTTWTDWNSTGAPVNYESSFTTGFGIKGLAQHKEQIQYLYMFLHNDSGSMAYKQQAIWDYATSGNSGKYTNLQMTQITEDPSNFGVIFKRHRLRGRGLVFQFRIVSVDGEPFNIIGWSIDERVNQGA